MTTTSTPRRTASEIDREGTHLLFEALGVVDALRYLNHHGLTQGDYTAERQQAEMSESTADVFALIEAEQKA